MAKDSKSSMIQRLKMKTELQWNKLNKVIVDYDESLSYYNHFYYSEDNTREMTEAELKEFKEERKAERKAREEERNAWLKYCEDRRAEYGKYKTAYQFLKEGRVVVDGAKHRYGKSFSVRHKGNDFYFGKSSDYFYYHIDDTVEDLERSMELLETFPERYDGRKWW